QSYIQIEVCGANSIVEVRGSTPLASTKILAPCLPRTSSTQETRSDKIGLGPNDNSIPTEG
ncbi:MAG TPA: hypothetical protein VHK27_13960, partial [Gammaproteobacteria bacterium]|nr:hypothetical protein [Gammaproteobacteria bacterium]